MGLGTLHRTVLQTPTAAGGLLHCALKHVPTAPKIGCWPATVHWVPGSDAIVVETAAGWVFTVWPDERG